MTVVLTDQEIDRAEAFRLARRYRLKDPVALGDDPKLLRLQSFCELNRIEDTLIMKRILRNRTDITIQSTISRSQASYTDRLAHIVDLDDPVSFVDLRGVLPTGLRPPPPATTSCPDDPRSAEGGEGRPSVAQVVPESGQ